MGTTSLGCPRSSFVSVGGPTFRRCRIVLSVFLIASVGSFYTVFTACYKIKCFQGTCEDWHMCGPAHVRTSACGLAHVRKWHIGVDWHMCGLANVQTGTRVDWHMCGTHWIHISFLLHILPDIVHTAGHCTNLNDLALDSVIVSSTTSPLFCYHYI